MTCPLITKPNTCVDTSDVDKLFVSEKNLDTLILEFYPYKNWGRWNHNPSRIQTLIDKLVELGFNVQLKHITDEDINKEGNIHLRDENEKISFIYERFQSNINASKKEEIIKTIIENLEKQI